MCHVRDLSYSFFMKLYSVTLNLSPQNSHQFVFSAIICDRDEQRLKMSTVFKELHNYDSQLRLCTKMRQFLRTMKAAFLWFWETASKNSSIALSKSRLKKPPQKITKSVLRRPLFEISQDSFLRRRFVIFKAAFQDFLRQFFKVTFCDSWRQLFEAAFWASYYSNLSDDL